MLSNLRSFGTDSFLLWAIYCCRPEHRRPGRPLESTAVGYFEDVEQISRYEAQTPLTCLHVPSRKQWVFYATDSRIEFSHPGAFSLIRDKTHLWGIKKCKTRCSSRQISGLDFRGQLSLLVRMAGGVDFIIDVSWWNWNWESWEWQVCFNSCCHSLEGEFPMRQDVCLPPPKWKSEHIFL